MSGKDSCTPSAAIVRLTLDSGSEADNGQDLGKSSSVAASTPGKSSLRQQHIGALFNRQKESKSADASGRNTLNLSIAMPSSLTGDHVQTPKRHRSISADYDILMSADAVNGEIPIESVMEEAKTHTQTGE